MLASMAQGETTSEALLEAHIQRMTSRNPALNAIVTTDLQTARGRAKAADAARAQGESWGPLHGLPMTIKDSYDVVGMTNTSGAKSLAEHRPERNADAVQRLIDAGAVIFGKTNLPVYAGEWQSFNPVHGTTNNPWDVRRTPGGSSGGSAASVAADLTPLELGSDIGGSVRIPAHFCGVFGHKPTHGLIPLRGHIPGGPGTQSEPDLAVAGPLARSARDLALMMNVLVGPRREDAPAWSLALPEAPAMGLDTCRVAVWMGDAACPLESDVESVLEGALETLGQAGLKTTRASPAGLGLAEIAEPYVKLLSPIIASGMPDRIVRRFAAAHPGLKLWWRVRPPLSALLPSFIEGALQRHRDWLRLHEKRCRIQQRVEAWFQDVDVLLMPVAPWAAFPHAHDGELLFRQITTPRGTRAYVDHLYWIALATMLGLPATSIPVGRTSSGLPVNLQVVSARYRDATCFAFAEMVERTLGGFVAPPTL